MLQEKDGGAGLFLACTARGEGDLVDHSRGIAAPDAEVPGVFSGLYRALHRHRDLHSRGIMDPRFTDLPLRRLPSLAGIPAGSKDPPPENPQIPHTDCSQFPAVTRPLFSFNPLYT